MEKLSNAEKARAYDEALDKIRMLLGTGSSCSREELEYVFPELKESEDEKVRKEILKELKEQQDNIPYPPTPNEMARYGLLQRWMDWLKQYEQKPIDKVESIFNIGDTIVKKHNSNMYFTITDITGGKYWYNDRIICNISEQDEWEIYESTKSAEWSEEDEESLNWFDKFFRAESVIAEGKDIPQDKYLWFKNLKDRVHLQFFPQQEWSEEDENRMDNLCHFLLEYGNQYYGHLTLQGIISWLKSLRLQPKQKWSEEDEKMTIKICQDLYDYPRIKSPFDNESFKEAQKEVQFIKSLKPQKQWESSDEQIKALEAMLTVSPQSPAITSALIELYQNLKKLREE